MEKLRGKEAIGHISAVSLLNFSDEIRADMELPKRVKLVDMSLKEGRQMEGVVLSNEQYFNVARKLEELGVPAINVAYRLKRPEDMELMKGLSKLRLKAEIVVLLANNQSPPLYSREALVESIDSVLDFGYTPFMCISLSDRLLRGFADLRLEKNKSLDYLKEYEVQLGVEVVQHVKNKGGTIGINLQDPMRCDLDFLNRVCKELADAGIDFIIFDDLCMPGIPAVFKYIVRRARKVAPGATFGWYVHDDLGFGLGAALASVEGGAGIQFCTVNGYGKRGGMVDLAQLAVALEFLYGFNTGIHLEKLFDVSKLFADIYGQPLPSTKPIVGNKAFSHTAEWHVQFLSNPDHLRNPDYPWIFQSVAPEVVGQKARVAFSSASGQMSIRMKAAELGIKLSVEQAERVWPELRDELVWRNRPLEDDEFIKIIQRVLPKAVQK